MLPFAQEQLEVSCLIYFLNIFFLLVVSFLVNNMSSFMHKFHQQFSHLSLNV